MKYGTRSNMLKKWIEHTGDTSSGLTSVEMASKLDNE
jgi:hypothetical protein